MADVSVTEFTDPGCSWAWGSEPKLRLFRHRHGERLAWQRVMGGLFADLRRDNPDFDAETLAADFARYWQAVATRTGMPWPARLRWVYWSTEPSCRAVKAAERQGVRAADEALRRLREATFVFGEPPDSAERIARALGGARDVDTARVVAELDHPEVTDAFTADWEETRQPNKHVRELDDDREGSGAAKRDGDRWRYVFPTLVVRGPQGERTVPGWQPYDAYVAALEAVSPGVTADPAPDPGAAEALRESGSLAVQELAVLCGEADAPAEAVAYDYGDGVFWLDRDLARARQLA